MSCMEENGFYEFAHFADVIRQGLSHPLPTDKENTEPNTPTGI